MNFEGKMTKIRKRELKRAIKTILIDWYCAEQFGGGGGGEFNYGQHRDGTFWALYKNNNNETITITRTIASEIRMWIDEKKKELELINIDAKGEPPPNFEQPVEPYIEYDGSFQ